MNKEVDEEDHHYCMNVIPNIDEYKKWIYYFDDGAFTVKHNEFKLWDITLKIPKNAENGIYAFDIFACKDDSCDDVCTSENSFDKESIYVTVESGDSNLPDNRKQLSEHLKGAEAIKTCNDLCNKYEISGDETDAINYCLQKVSADLSDDGVIKDSDKGSFLSINLPYGLNEVCEEHIYCPMINDAQCVYNDSGRLTMELCMIKLCDYYQKNGLTAEQATQKISNVLQLGECGIEGTKEL